MKSLREIKLSGSFLPPLRKNHNHRIGRRCGSTVAQVFNLLYRRFAIGARSNAPSPADLRSVSRMQFCDTADWKSTLRRFEPYRLAIALLVLACGGSCCQAASLVKDAVNWEAFLRRHDLVWNRMPTNWSRAAFLGNGRLAMFVHQEPGTNAVRFGVDRTDVFDRRDPSWGWTAFGRARYHVGDFQLHPAGIITGDVATRPLQR